MKIFYSLVLILGLYVGAQAQASTKVNKIGYTSRAFTATAYCLKGRTASGSMVRPGIIASDPRVLPLGSKVLVNGDRYTVTDTGGKIKGLRVDVWVSSCASAIKYGRRTVAVQLLK